MVASYLDRRPIVAALIGGALVLGGRELGWSDLAAVGAAGLGLAIIVGIAKTTTA